MERKQSNGINNYHRDLSSMIGFFRKRYLWLPKECSTSYCFWSLHRPALSFVFCNNIKQLTFVFVVFLLPFPPLFSSGKSFAVLLGSTRSNRPPYMNVHVMCVLKSGLHRLQRWPCRISSGSDGQGTEEMLMSSNGRKLGQERDCFWEMSEAFDGLSRSIFRFN